MLIVQMLGDLALLGAGARVLLGAVRLGQQRRSIPVMATLLPSNKRLRQLLDLTGARA